MPAELSDIESRKEIDIHYNLIDLPIFAAPMDTVVDMNNLKEFTSLGINVCLPRGLQSKVEHTPDSSEFLPYVFESYGLTDFDKFVKDDYDGIDISDYVLIDVANGHMKKIYQLVRKFKKKYPNKVLMVGNVANPMTYRLLSASGADFVRVGIGNGAGCLTTQQTGVGFPMASLIQECHRERLALGKSAKIVADGGFKKYSDVIKALALGADYVMLGSILNKTIESSGHNYILNGKLKVSQKQALKLYNRGFKVTKKFRGMSTKEVQKNWGRSILKTSEGVVKVSFSRIHFERLDGKFLRLFKNLICHIQMLGL